MYYFPQVQPQQQQHQTLPVSQQQQQQYPTTASMIPQQQMLQQPATNNNAPATMMQQVIVMTPQGPQIMLIPVSNNQQQAQPQMMAMMMPPMPSGGGGGMMLVPQPQPQHQSKGPVNNNNNKGIANLPGVPGAEPGTRLLPSGKTLPRFDGQLRCFYCGEVGHKANRCEQNPDMILKVAAASYQQQPISGGAVVAPTATDAPTSSRAYSRPAPPRSAVVGRGLSDAIDDDEVAMFITK
eukprot:PhM_4_TR17512/c0_g1_i2/m.51064